jgi:hypothetical protein
MELRSLLGQVIAMTLDGCPEEALLAWSTRRNCTPSSCDMYTGAGACAAECVLPRLLELSLIYDRDNAYKAYLQLKGYICNVDNIAPKDNRTG